MIKRTELILGPAFPYSFGLKSPLFPETFA